jgi:drug/metabolite transporter (DMT)-like permease
MNTRPTGSTPKAASAAWPKRTLGPGAIATMLMLCAIWGLGQIAIKIGAEGISPLFQAGLRSAGASCVLLAWMAWRRVPLRATPGLWPWRLAIGTAFAAEFVCLYIGLGMTSAAHATILLYGAPFFVALGSHVMLNDRLSPSRWLGLLIAFAGLTVAIAGQGKGAADQTSLAGDVLCVLAAAGWAATTLILKASPLHTERPERTLFDQLSVSAVLLLVMAFAVGEPGVFAPSPKVWLAFAYQTVVIATFSYLGWFVMVQRYSPATVSAFSFITPIFGVSFAVLLLGETPTASLLAAVVLVAAGIRMVNRPSAPAPQAAASLNDR